MEAEQQPVLPQEPGPALKQRQDLCQLLPVLVPVAQASSRHSLNKTPRLPGFARRRKGRFACLPERARALPPEQQCQLLPLDWVRRLSKAHHIRHKKQTHPGFHGLKNNILTWYSNLPFKT